jgi:hypothetical protein
VRGPRGPAPGEKVAYRVALDLDIDEAGRVVRAAPVVVPERAGDAARDAAWARAQAQAQTAALATAWEPARLGGRPVAVTTRLEIGVTREGTAVALP